MSASPIGEYSGISLVSQPMPFVFPAATVIECAVNHLCVTDMTHGDGVDRVIGVEKGTSVSEVTKAAGVSCHLLDLDQPCSPAHPKRDFYTHSGARS